MQQVLTGTQFARRLRNFAAMAAEREQLLYERTVDHVELSMTVGSHVTGAPGVPVKSGDLLRSYQRTGSIAARDVAIVSNLPYAHIIEHNRRGAQLRSKVGGFHSNKITRLNFRLIVAYELALVKSQVRLRA